MTSTDKVRRFKNRSIAVSLAALLVLTGAGLLSCANNRGGSSENEAQSMAVESGSLLDEHLNVGGDTPITKLNQYQGGMCISGS